MQGTQGNFASRVAPGSNDSVARASFSAGPDGTIKADTDVRGDASLRMNGSTTNQAGQTNTFSMTENSAQQQIEQIASEPGNSALKMNLAQNGISLTDHSDVGPGKRFATFQEKLKYIMKLKTALLVAVIMSMASSSGWGPSRTESVTEAREALRTGRTEEQGRDPSAERDPSEDGPSDRDPAQGDTAERGRSKRDSSDMRSSGRGRPERDPSDGRPSNRGRSGTDGSDRGASQKGPSDRGQSGRSASARASSET